MNLIVPFTPRVAAALGSARGSRAGFGVSPKQSFVWLDLRLIFRLKESSRWRDANASTRDACATQKHIAEIAAHE
jgi:hypothetical protein